VQHVDGVLIAVWRVAMPVPGGAFAPLVTFDAFAVCRGKRETIEAGECHVPHRDVPMKGNASIDKHERCTSFPSASMALSDLNEMRAGKKEACLFTPAIKAI